MKIEYCFLSLETGKSPMKVFSELLRKSEGGILQRVEETHSGFVAAIRVQGHPASGAIYVFDAYQNLIVDPLSVSFELSSPSGTVQKRNVETRHGAAWAAMDSTTQQGIDKFAARTGDVYATRIVGQVPGDPCGLKMTARQAGQTVQLTTDPLRDCSGNAIPDGTIVTFTETYSGAQSTVDVPLKHGIAQVQMPTHSGALISVASGVVAGNQIRWEK